jgi:hypothetical protein
MERRVARSRQVRSTKGDSLMEGFNGYSRKHGRMAEPVIGRPAFF